MPRAGCRLLIMLCLRDQCLLSMHNCIVSLVRVPNQYAHRSGCAWPDLLQITSRSKVVLILRANTRSTAPAVPQRQRPSCVSSSLSRAAGAPEADPDGILLDVEDDLSSRSTEHIFCTLQHVTAPCWPTCRSRRRSERGCARCPASSTCHLRPPLPVHRPETRPIAGISSSHMAPSWGHHCASPPTSQLRCESNRRRSDIFHQG